MESFNLPICYLKNKTKFEDHIISDLELNVSNDNAVIDDNTSKDKDKDKDKDNGKDNSKEIVNTNSTGIYDYVFNPKTEYSKKMINNWCEYYTSDKKYILDTQQLLKDTLPNTNNTLEEFEEIFSGIKKETGFYEKYKYIDNTWPLAHLLNNNAFFLLLLGVYNIASPVLTLSMPIFFLILPFFIIKLQGYPITLDKYKNVLMHVIQKHQLGKLFTVASSSWDQRIYILISLAFYAFQIYQNFMSCKTFYKNSKTIFSQLLCTRDYISNSIGIMNDLERLCKNKESYKDFIYNMSTHKEVLEKYHSCLVKLKYNNGNKFNYKNIHKMGAVMLCFNKLYNNENITNSLEYSLYLQGYLDNIKNVQTNIKKKHLHFCKLTKKHTTFKNAFYPPLLKDTVKNSYNLKKQLLITGPNAAGKTTILKTTLFNIIISQQLGCGFYDKANINPYDRIHSYINIPDTSGRDSLFQAEARRCKNIIDNINNTNNKYRHFCVFDELYSGTNPYEAISSAISFLKYVNNYKNINFMITTHFLDICKKLDHLPDFKNNFMNVKETDSNFTYTYKLKSGISTIKGGVKVLQDLKYPPEIISETKQIIQTLNI
mgnify:CR=1 FL=1